MRHVPKSTLWASVCCSRSLKSSAFSRQQPRQWLHQHEHQRWATTLSNSIVQHRHLTGDSPAGFTKYDAAEDLQEQYRAKFLAWKGLPEHSRTSNDCPKPHLISFESMPIFTLGRRQDDLTSEQTARLEWPLDVTLSRQNETIKQHFLPQVKKTNRGGLTTYHGPGQLVLWPVLDMHSPLYTKYSVSSYASHLESTTQRLLAELFNIHTYTNRDEPGVWVKTSTGQPRKIAALGVHHRRYVTALGTAINIDVPVTGSEDANPWARFIPCGLEGKLVTSVAAETGSAGTSKLFDMPSLARKWASIFEEGLVDASKRGADLGR